MLNNRQSYKYYKKQVDDPVDISTYVDLCNRYGQFLIDKAIDGYRVTLPAKLGLLMVVGNKQKVKIVDGEIRGLAIDWVKTKLLRDRSEEARKERKLVYHTNEHSDGIRYKFFWKKKNVIIANKNVYSLKVSRANKRKLSQRIKDGQDYLTYKN